MNTRTPVSSRNFSNIFLSCLTNNFQFSAENEWSGWWLSSQIRFTINFLHWVHCPGQVGVMSWAFLNSFSDTFWQHSWWELSWTNSVPCKHSLWWQAKHSQHHPSCHKVWNLISWTTYLCLSTHSNLHWLYKLCSPLQLTVFSILRNVISSLVLNLYDYDMNRIMILCNVSTCLQRSCPT